MLNMPTLRFEMEGIKHTVQTVFNDHNQDLAKYIEAVLEETLTEEWVQAECKKAVDGAVRSAIRKLSDNWQVQRAIEDSLGDSIAGLIRGNDK